MAIRPERHSDILSFSLAGVDITCVLVQGRDGESRGDRC